MKSAVLEISRISESLPPRKATQLLEYARSLVSKKSKSGADGDVEWERIISNPRSRPKLRARIKQVDELIAAGKTEPMNFDRL